MRHAARRVQFVAIPAHVGELHFHGVGRVPADRLVRLIEVAPTVWKQLVPSGNLLVREMIDQTVWINYITRNKGGRGLIDEFIYSGEFWIHNLIG